MKSCFVFADRIRGQGVIIEFGDRASALYSASLLRSMLPQATKLKGPAKSGIGRDCQHAEQSRAK
jgi:hypothetical protein